ncbi:hypothetical protein L3X38_023662 [Prunus dulcis]|uniref:Uncharacterized protein n=1 Tax=Prunus dulcis TaxID=3755 RepID=A0AAD4Z5J1_PRUDU|nr:hypothetical protein L3X38_023662 [Prunus dulcis]
MSGISKDLSRILGKFGAGPFSWYQSHSAVWCECADEDVGSLKGGGLNKSVRGGVGPAQSGQYLARWSWASPLRHSSLEEAFWELTGFGFVGTPKLSQLEARAIPGWVTTLGSCSVSSQKQNRAGSEGGPKRTISCYGGAGPGCDTSFQGVK